MQETADLALLMQARTVLARYPGLATIQPRPLDLSSGFSGAVLWKADTPAGPVYLRAWPPGESPERLLWIHRLQGCARRAGLSFVPALVPDRSRSTLVEQAGRCWEVGQWMPGQADFHARPSDPRLHAAGKALAQMHQAWASEMSAPLAPIPALLRRQQALQTTVQYLKDHPTRDEILLAPGQAILRRAETILRRLLPTVPEMLARWTTRDLPLQPCLCDPWHDHILYQGDEVTGVIDYGAALMDHPAVDVARLLGSLVPDGDWSPALDGYRSERRFTDEEEALARTLDRTGAILAIGRWLPRLESGPHSPRHLARVQELIQRVERW